MKTRFTAMLIEANAIDPDDFQSWAFCPGMQFNSSDKWWGDHGRRDFPHEGVDFCLHLDRDGELHRLDHETRIPAMCGGVVRAMFNDYLGQAIIVAHEDVQGGAGRYLTVYAHTRPLAGIKPGVVVKEGDIVATIADTSRSKAKILPHLHFSLGRPSPDIVYESFVWNYMRHREFVALLDPQSLIDWPCQVLNRQNSNCLEF